MEREPDTSEQARRLLILTWSGVAGVIGGLAGFLVANLNGWTPLPAILTGLLLAAGGLYVVVTIATNAAAGAATKLYAPARSGSTTWAEYSRAESLEARGRYDEAVGAYRQHAEEEPDNPEPVLRLARLYRDRLQRYEDAATQFRRARGRAVDPGIRHLVTRELIELYTKRSGEPASALVELARLADEQAGTPIGEWARTELARLKAVPRD